MGKEVSSLARGINILKCFSEEKPRLTLTEISNMTGINKTAVKRHVSTLEDLKFIDRDEYKRYGLGIEILTLGFNVLRSHGLRDLAYPFLKEVSDMTNQTVNLWVLSGIELVLIERIEVKKIIDNDLKVGSKLPVYCSASGKAVLAYLSDEDREDVLNRVKFHPFTMNTLMDKESLLHEMNQVRVNGYALLNQELSLNSRGVGAPVFGRNGDVVAGVSMAVNASEYSIEDVIEKFSPHIVQLSRKISKLLDWKG